MLQYLQDIQSFKCSLAPPARWHARAHKATGQKRKATSQKHDLMFDKGPEAINAS